MSLFSLFLIVHLFSCPVFLNHKPVLNISFVPLLFFPGNLSFLWSRFTTMKQNSCRSDHKTMGWRWWKNTAGWWHRHAATVQRPVRLILEFSLIPLCVDAQLTVCVLSSNFSKIRLSPYTPELNYWLNWGESVCFSTLHGHCTSHFLPIRYVVTGHYTFNLSSSFHPLNQQGGMRVKAIDLHWWRDRF